MSIEAMELKEAKINENAKIVRILPLQYRHNDSPRGASLQIRGLVKPEP